MIVIVGPDFRRVHGLGHRGIDRSRRHGIDADTVLRELGGLLLGQVREPRLAGPVGDAQRGGPQARDRGDVDDGAAALVAHDRRHRLGHQEGTGEVDRQHPLPLLQRHVQHRLEHRDARVVDQCIDAAELPVRLLHGVLHRRRVGDIGLERQRRLSAVQAH